MLSARSAACPPKIGRLFKKGAAGQKTRRTSKSAQHKKHGGVFVRPAVPLIKDLWRGSSPPPW
ncbi:hypothetical protein A8B74_15145 [Sulfitobacter geojensis]|nr:hypothetical protein A8B74_15145 [Sulfitobacter geojensis]